MRLANPLNIPHVPHVDAMIVVDASQLVISLIERQCDRVRIPRVRRMLRHMAERAKANGKIFFGRNGELSRCVIAIKYKPNG